MLVGYLKHFYIFFNDTATTEIYTLSLHDALPISEVDGYSPRPLKSRKARQVEEHSLPHMAIELARVPPNITLVELEVDRKSTRLNSSHANISYAVFCLKKKINRKYEL